MLAKIPSVMMLNTSSHAHICCTSCGRVDDIMMDFNECLGEVSKHSSYDVHRHQFYFYGTCSECQAKKVKAS